MNRRTVLVTGAAGFIGSHVCEALLERGHGVRGLDSFDSFYGREIKQGNIDAIRGGGRWVLLEGDIRNKADVREALRGCDSVIHLAARVGVRQSLAEPAEYMDVNVRGTAVVLDEAIRAGVKTFIAASSSSVYGAGSVSPFREEEPCNHPLSPYAASKRAMELLCRSIHASADIDLTCLRFFSVYGPRQRPEMAIHAFTRAIVKDQPISVFGGGKSGRDYTYIADIVDGVLMALAACKGFQTFNLGGARVVSLAELVTAIEQTIGKKALIQRLPEQPGDMETTCASLSRVEMELGYRPGVSLEVGLRRFFEWYVRRCAM
jgi:UDP-glucuronate 4-epimerase